MKDLKHMEKLKDYGTLPYALHLDLTVSVLSFLFITSSTHPSPRSSVLPLRKGRG